MLDKDGNGIVQRKELIELFTGKYENIQNMECGKLMERTSMILWKNATLTAMESQTLKSLEPVSKNDITEIICHINYI